MLVQAKAEEYFPKSTRTTTNTWPYRHYRETAGKLKLVAKAEEYFPKSTCATTNTWPYYRYRETAGKLNLVLGCAGEEKKTFHFIHSVYDQYCVIYFRKLLDSQGIFLFANIPEH